MLSCTKWHCMSFKLESFQNSHENSIYADFFLHTMHKERLAKQIKDARDIAGSVLKWTLEVSTYCIQTGGPSHKGWTVGFSRGPQGSMSWSHSPSTSRPGSSLTRLWLLQSFSSSLSQPSSCPPEGPCSFFCFNLIFILYWSIVDLQYCVSFRCIAKWFSSTYTYIYSFSDSLPI